MGDDITLAQSGGGARGGPAQPPTPPPSKIRLQNQAIFILEVYNLKPNNVWGQISSVVMNPYHFQTGN